MSADSPFPWRSSQALVGGKWKEAGSPKPFFGRTGHPLRLPQQTLLLLLTSNLAVSLKWLKFGTAWQAFPRQIR